MWKLDTSAPLSISLHTHLLILTPTMSNFPPLNVSANFHQLCGSSDAGSPDGRNVNKLQSIKGEEEYLGCHGWTLGCRGSVVCFEALILAVQTHNYELSEVRKLPEMNRQRGSRLLEGKHQSESQTLWKWMSLTPKTRYPSFTKTLNLRLSTCS